MIVTDHPAVAAYLARLDALCAHLPADRREELRTDLLDHLRDALPDDADEASVRAALDRLGPPEDIVAAEQGPDPVATTMEPGGAGVREALAVAFLTVGSFIPVIGWLVGAVLLWTSKRFTPGEKLAATLLVPGGPGAVALVFLSLAVVPAGDACTAMPTAVAPAPVPGTPTTAGPTAGDALDQTTSCSSGVNVGGVVLTALFAIAFVVPFVVAVVVFRRASRRTVRL
jgi:hypothetical protein